jgi:hypothetical protein
LGAKPMEIWWGTASDPINVKLSADDESYNACSRTFAWWQRLWRAVFDPASLRSSCPYHSVLPVEALLNGGMENGKPDSDIENLVRDRVVFYGASLHGMGDESVTPVSGLLPDVFVHAMALDNLMTIPGGPLRDLIDLGGWSLTRNQIQIVTIVPVILLLAWIHIIRLRRRTPPQEKASGLAYAIRSIEEFLWWVLTVVLAIAAGVIAMLVTHIAVVTWVGLILVSAEIGAALAAGLPDRLWGYMRHVLTGDGEAPGRQRG